MAGPDFGGDADDGQYLPACRRYIGRFFEAIPEPKQWDAAWSQELRTLIVSGLYGLLHPEEPVQQYDIHLADEWSAGVRSERLVDYWRPLVTDVVLDLARRSGRKTQIVDLLSERLYQSVVDWQRVREAGFRVYHRCFAESQWEEALSNSGRFFCHEFLDEREPRRTLEWDRFEERAYFDPPTDRILFERALGDTAETVVREGDEAVEATLEKEVGPRWATLGPEVRGWLKQADANHRLISQGRPDAADDYFEFGSLLAKALEHLIKKDVFEPLRLHAPEVLDQAERDLASRHRRTAPSRFKELSTGGLRELSAILGERATRDPSGFSRLAQRWPGMGLADIGGLLGHLAERFAAFNGLAGREKRHGVKMDRVEFEQSRTITIDILRTWPFGPPR